MELAVALDVGGTKIASGLVGPRGLVGPVTTDPTDTSGEPGLLKQILNIARSRLEAAGGPRSGAALGLAVAGLVQQPGGVMRTAPNLPLHDVALAERLWGALGVPVIVDNDSNAAALAESRLGAARGLSEVVCLTLGTGIGGGIITDGSLYRGATGMGGEIGHIVVEPDGPLCNCGHRGHLEALSSGKALEREAREQAEAGRETLIMGLAGGDVSRIAGEMVTEAGRRGDALALEILGRAGRYLGIALAGLAAILEPEMIVIGGGLSAAGDMILEPAREALSEYLVGSEVRDVPPVVPAALGPEAGVIGAGLVVLEAESR